MADLSADWLGAKADYFVLTGEKKPKEAVAKFFSTTHTGLSKSIKKLGDLKEANLDAAKKAKDFKKSLADFQSAASTYVKLLQKLIDDEKKAGLLKLDEKDEIVKVTTARLKGMKMLKTRLEDYDATFTQQSGIFEAIAKGLSSVERVESQISIGLKKGFKRAAAASAAIKAKPTVTTWNAELEDGVRSLTTALGVFKTLNKMYTDKGLVVPAKVTREIAAATQWVTTLKPWADGAKRTLTEGADVLAELKPMMVQVKACMTVYAAYLT